MKSSDMKNTIANSRKLKNFVISTQKQTTTSKKILKISIQKIIAILDETGFEKLYM